MSQRSIRSRLYICVPLFSFSIALLLWQIGNPDGFNVIWQYFGWANQTLSVFTLWTLTVYLVRENKPYFITLIPALLMTTVCSTFLFVSKQAFGLAEPIAYGLGGAVLLIAIVWFTMWMVKEKKQQHSK